MLNKIFFIIFISSILSYFSYAKGNVFIVTTVENQIITNYDVDKESEYLKILNPNLSQLNAKQIQKIAKNSLINEIIKKNEIEKILDIKKENSFVSEYMINLYKKLNFESEKEFKNFLSNSSSYSFEEIKEKIKIEIMWNELIYFKYGEQVSINKNKLLKKIENLSDKVRKEFNLSEILFKKKKETSLNEQINNIKNSIAINGFGNTANIYSISDSAKMGGDIDWVNENNLSDIIFNEIKNLKKNEISNVIQIGNNYLILKINEIREIKISINKEQELDKMIKFETNKQLNQFSKIFFDKAKINYSINEK